MSKLLGVLGGMGPMASGYFYNLITRHTVAEKDQDHIPMLIYSDTKIPDRTEAILSGDFKEVEDALLADIKYMEKCGCTHLAVTCNTAHFFFDRLEGQFDLELINIVDETAKVAAARGGKVGILATDGTVKTGLFQKSLEKYGAEYYVPTPENQKNVMSLIYDDVKKNNSPSVEKMASIDKELNEAGCSCAILGCTELSVIEEDRPPKAFYIDAMEVLAKKCIEIIKGPEFVK